MAAPIPPLSHVEAALTRRAVLRGIGVGVAVLQFGPLIACDTASAAAGEECPPYPNQTAGPYDVPNPPVRASIVEDREGIPLALRITIVDASSCAALSNVLVDIWHADARGMYSGFPGQGDDRRTDTRGQLFLRGMQRTDSDGVTAFSTIYPGWYPGRTTHIHFKVHFDGRTALTSQLYFPDDVTAEVYRRGIYATRGGKDTTNARDLGSRGGLPLLSVTADGSDRYLATLRIGVGGR